VAAGLGAWLRLYGFLNVGVDDLTASAVGSGPSSVFFVEGIADARFFMRATNFFSKSAAIESWTNKAFGGNAGLAIVDDASLDGGDDGGVKIGAGHDDERIAATEFENDFLDALGGGDSNFNACLLASGEGRGDDARVVEDGVDLL